MREFSASDAALEGFSLIRCQWRVVAGWSLFTLVAMIAVGLLTVALGVALVAANGGDAEAAGAASLVASLGALVVQLVLVTGLLRLMLRPEQPGFLHLRLGGDELRSGGVTLVFGIAAALLAGFGYWLTVHLRLLMSWAGLPTALAIGLLGVWLAARFALALPVSFVERRIDFMTSWRLTRRRGWALIGTWALTVCLVLLVSVVAWLALFLCSLPFVGLGGLGSLTGREGFESHPGVFLLQGVAEILFLPVLVVLSQAPLVAAYRALGEGAAEQP